MSQEGYFEIEFLVQMAFLKILILTELYCGQKGSTSTGLVYFMSCFGWFSWTKMSYLIIRWYLDVIELNSPWTRTAKVISWLSQPCKLIFHQGYVDSLTLDPIIVNSTGCTGSAKEIELNNSKTIFISLNTTHMCSKTWVSIFVIHVLKSKYCSLSDYRYESMNLPHIVLVFSSFMMFAWMFFQASEVP